MTRKYLTLALLSGITFFNPEMLSAQNDTTATEPLVITDSLRMFYNRKGKLVQKTDDEVYFGMSNVFGFRTIKERDGLFGSPLGVREDEVPLWTRSFELGFRTSMSPWMMMEIGVEFNQIGLQYQSPDDEEFLAYQRIKRHLSVPFRAVFQWGDRFLIQGSVGVAPKMFLSTRYTSVVKNEFDKEVETTEKFKDSYTYFNLDVLANIGVRWNLGRNVGVYFIPEFRYGLLDVYQKQKPHVQHLYGVYLRWGVQWLL